MSVTVLLSLFNSFLGLVVNILIPFSFLFLMLVSLLLWFVS